MLIETASRSSKLQVKIRYLLEMKLRCMALGLSIGYGNTSACCIVILDTSMAALGPCACFMYLPNPLAEDSVTLETGSEAPPPATSITASASTMPASPPATDVEGDKLSPVSQADSGKTTPTTGNSSSGVIKNPLLQWHSHLCTPENIKYFYFGDIVVLFNGYFKMETRLLYW